MKEEEKVFICAEYFQTGIKAKKRFSEYKSWKEAHEAGLQSLKTNESTFAFKVGSKTIGQDETKAIWDKGLIFRPGEVLTSEQFQSKYPDKKPCIFEMRSKEIGMIIILDGMVKQVKRGDMVLSEDGKSLVGIDPRAKITSVRPTFASPKVES